jgi:acyl-CoA thioesterase
MKKNVLESLKEQIRNEPFANHMGIRLRDIGPGYAVMEARFSEKMKNFNGLIHGGAIFALIDEAFGAASNSHGTIALALNINITYLQPPRMNSFLSPKQRKKVRANALRAIALRFCREIRMEIKNSFLPGTRLPER